MAGTGRSRSSCTFPSTIRTRRSTYHRATNRCTTCDEMPDPPEATAGRTSPVTPARSGTSGVRGSGDGHARAPDEHAPVLRPVLVRRRSVRSGSETAGGTWGGAEHLYRVHLGPRRDAGRASPVLQVLPLRRQRAGTPDPGGTRRGRGRDRRTPGRARRRHFRRCSRSPASLLHPGCPAPTSSPNRSVPAGSRRCTAPVTRRRRRLPPTCGAPATGSSSGTSRATRSARNGAPTKSEASSTTCGRIATELENVHEDPAYLGRTGAAHRGAARPPVVGVGHVSDAGSENAPRLRLIRSPLTGMPEGRG